VLAAFLLASTAVATAATPSTFALQESLAALRSTDPQVRMTAVQKIGGAGPDELIILQKELEKSRPFSPESYRRLILEIGAQVPNWKASSPMWVQKPPPPWVPPPRVPGRAQVHRPPPHDPEQVEWAAALNGLDLEKPELADVPDRQMVRSDALEIVALMRGIANSHRMEATAPLFKIAFELDGVFRDECGRQIRRLESYAIPTLIERMHQKGPNFSRQRRYAAYQLDRMDRARPSKAISTAPDDRVRAAIIHAYGESRALDAVEAILGQVDSPSHRVRREARWAWLRYVMGKAPPPAPRRRRKLPGGHEEREEKPDYLTYREIALLALQKELQEINSSPPSAKASAAALTKELFEYYDRKHAAEWEEQFAAAQAKEKASDFKGAVSEYGWILAHDPDYSRRAEMVDAYVRYADQLRNQKEYSRAVGYYRIAADLDPAGATNRTLQARIALLDGFLALERGKAMPEWFRQALALDPHLDEARAGLRRVDGLHRRNHLVDAGLASGALFAVLLLGWLLWRRIDSRGLQGN
jgi:tetratricopeptide (TPR) repeat protein